VSAADVPTANFTSNITNGSAPLSVQFTCTSTGHPTSWDWNFGDNGTSNERDPVHTYNTPGNYNVSLTAINDAGNNTIIKNDWITVNYPAPTADFTADKVECLVPLSVDFTDLSTGNITSWYWDFGEGNTSTEQNPTNVYITPGIYTVKETVTGPGGNNTLILSDYISIPDTTPPVVKSNLSSGLYNSTQTVTLTATDIVNDNPTIYYTLDGSTPTRNSMPSGEKVYSGPITISNEGCTILKFIAIDGSGNISNLITENYTIDTIKPTATASLDTGLYNTNKIVKLSMSENGTIYYTTNGIIPTTSSNKYTGPINISSTTELKYIAVDLAGNKSSVYTKTYTIDKIPPRVLSTSPKNLATNISRTATITLKFSENIKTNTNWSKIYVKDLNTGKIIAIDKIISGNILIIKTGIKSANHWYQVYLPAAAVKDIASNKNSITTFKYKTN
jgi:PKD repeat protein